MSALEGSDTDQDCVSHPQKHCLATIIVISFTVPCLLLLKQVNLSMGLLMQSLNFWTYLVEVGVAIDFRVNPRVTLMGSWGCLLYIRKYGTESHGRILGAFLSVDQYSNTAFPVRLAFWQQHPWHIDQGGVKIFKLTICLGVIWAGSRFLGPR